MRDDLKSAAKRLGQSLQESKKLFNQLSAQSRAASTNSSSTLFGMIGGFVGMGAAYALPFYTTATFLGLAPILAGAGVVAGVLVFRGTGRFKLERRLEAQKRALESVREEIRLLPKNAPQAVRDEAWETYRRLLSASPLPLERSALPPPQQVPQLPHTSSIELGQGTSVDSKDHRHPEHGSW